MECEYSLCQVHMATRPPGPPALPSTQASQPQSQIGKKKQNKTRRNFLGENRSRISKTPQERKDQGNAPSRKHPGHWLTLLKSEHSKGAEKASCRETVVQKGAFAESIFFSPPQGLLLIYLKTLEFIEKMLLCIFAFWTTVSQRNQGYG